MVNKVIKSFILLLLVMSCTGKRDNDILLRAGKYEFNVMDYNMFETRTNNQFTDSKTEEKLISNAYILAFAFENRYDTIKLLSKKLDYGMRLYSSEVNGFVWNIKVKPNLKVSIDDIKKAYKKRSIEYTIEIIGFPNGTEIEKYINLITNLNTEKGFSVLRKNVASNPEVTTTVLKSVYPFNPFSVYTDKIYQAQKGDVLGPFKIQNGFYILHVIEINSLKQPSFKDEKNVIEQELIHVLTEKYISKSQEDIIKLSNPHIYDKAIVNTASKFDIQTRQWMGLDGNQVLMNYQFNGKKQFFTSADLVEFLNCEPVIIGSPSNPNDIKELMINFLMDIYLFEEAKSMHAESNDEYITFKRYYRNKLFVQHFYEQNIFPKMKITSAEVQKYYIENKSNLKGFETATISVYKFSDLKSALFSFRQINNYYNKNNNPTIQKLKPTNLPGLVSATEKVEINLSDTTNDVNLINAISKLNVGQTLMPLKIKEEYCVVYINQKEGNIILPLRYAKDIIERLLPEIKAKREYERQIAVLKMKFPLTVNRLKEYIQTAEK